MKRILAVSVIGVLCPGMAGAQTAGAVSSAQPQAVFSRYCAGCHNDKLKSGGMTLTKLDAVHPGQTPELAEKVIRKLSLGMMPPPGAPRPDTATLKSVADALAEAVDRTAAAHPDPGRPPLHRLNRTEYTNAIRDLLSINVDATSLLPADAMSHGFDNMADVLTTSPALMDAYIRAASKISRLAVGDPEVNSTVVKYSLPKELSQTRHVDGAPLGTRGGISRVHHFPADGEYVFKLSFYHSLDGPLFGKILGKGQQIEVSLDGARVSLFDIDPKMTKWDEMQTPPTRIQAGPHRVTAAFLEKFEGPMEDAVMPMEEALVDLNEADVAGLTPLVHLNDLSIAGPVNVTGMAATPSRRKIFTCRPAVSRDEAPCARKILSTLMRQAYRRPVTDVDLEDVMSLYQSGRNAGDFEAGIRLALQAILASPEFIFRFEHPPSDAVPGAPYRLTDLELASRLSFFLWSSLPDEELIALAGQGKLKVPAILEKQVRRMLADPRSETLATNFARQWLHLQNLMDLQPDAYQFPNYSKNLSESMLRETELFFQSVIREDRSIVDLLTADYTYVDELLARHYGLPDVSGSGFRRVQLSDPNRRGLLGQASILTLTSVSNRTSPVGRGKYVMEVLLGTPPPPPPPNVPALKDNTASGDAQMLSVRQQMEQHRAMEPCATCHKLMDPIGFALENFDAVGAWRARDGAVRVDASGQMFDGAKLTGPVSLREAIMKRSDAFVTSFTESLLAYGIGRVLEVHDMPAVRSIATGAATNGNRFSAFILGVVRSTPFQMSVVEAKTSTGEAAH
jgi:cytochrome c551/c552